MRVRPCHRCFKSVAVITIGVVVVLLAGCGYQPDLYDDHGIGRPRPRVGRYATDTIGGAVFLDSDNLGDHGYYNSLLERTGIVYTCRGGHIDIAHVRKSADWTAYIAERTFALLRKHQTRLCLVLSDPVHYTITIDYPDDWDERSPEEQEHLAREAAIAVGQYVSFLGSTWHEIITWFGYRNVPIYSEFPSSFSWEDSFSDLLGTHLGVQALRDTEHSFDEAMTLALENELALLGGQSWAVAAEASRDVEGRWYRDGFLFLVIMKKRHFDIGLDDGAITPWLVPDCNACGDAEPQSYPVPTLEPLFELGFSAKVELEPGGLERHRLLEAAYPDAETLPRRIVPAVHFHPIMAQIKAEAVEKYGPEVDVP